VLRSASQCRIRAREWCRVPRAAWRDDYNRDRPHSALANQTPEEFRDHHLALAVTNDQVQKFSPGLTL
jgi:putative transposase